MKKRKVKIKIDLLKLISFIIGIITLIYFTICIISYTSKTTKQVLKYTPKERTTTIIR